MEINKKSHEDEEFFHWIVDVSVCNIPELLFRHLIEEFPLANGLCFDSVLKRWKDINLWVKSKKIVSGLIKNHLFSFKFTIYMKSAKKNYFWSLLSNYCVDAFNQLS